MNFTVHMSIAIVFVLVQIYFQFRYKFKNISDLRFTEPQNIQDLRREIAVWQRAAASLTIYTKDEKLVQDTLLIKVKRLEKQLKKAMSSGAIEKQTYKTTLLELQTKVLNRI